MLSSPLSPERRPAVVLVAFIVTGVAFVATYQPRTRETALTFQVLNARTGAALPGPVRLTAYYQASLRLPIFCRSNLRPEWWKAADARIVHESPGVDLKIRTEYGKCGYKLEGLELEFPDYRHPLRLRWTPQHEWTALSEWRADGYFLSASWFAPPRSEQLMIVYFPDTNIPVHERLPPVVDERSVLVFPSPAEAIRSVLAEVFFGDRDLRGSHVPWSSLALVKIEAMLDGAFVASVAPRGFGRLNVIDPLDWTVEGRVETNGLRHRVSFEPIGDEIDVSLDSQSRAEIKARATKRADSERIRRRLLALPHWQRNEPDVGDILVTNTWARFTVSDGAGLMAGYHVPRLGPVDFGDPRVTLLRWTGRSLNDGMCRSPRTAFETLAPRFKELDGRRLTLSHDTSCNVGTGCYVYTEDKLPWLLQCKPEDASIIGLSPF